jgi:trans-aconitate 2-methyltransferase
VSPRDWDPASYDAFATARQRPAADLLAAIPAITVNSIIDLGCGSGLSAELLAARWPDAGILGIDRSQAMLDQAAARLPGGHFVLGDIGDLRIETRQDLMFANASLHWLDDHHALLPRLLREVRSGGVLAVQMPDNLREPSHCLMEETAREPEFQAALSAIPGRREALLKPEEYYDILAPHCEAVDIFTIHYRHRLESAAAIADFFATTGLKPYLDCLNKPLRGRFLARYREGLREAYPPRVDGQVLLTLPRLFIIATRL